MVLFPAKFKHKKQHRVFNNLVKKVYTLPIELNSMYCIQAKKPFILHSNQLLVLQKCINRCIRKKYKSKLITLISPNLPLTKKSSGVRMGKGVGGINSWCFIISRGRVLFSILKGKLPFLIFLRACNAVSNRSGGKLSGLF